MSGLYCKLGTLFLIEVCIEWTRNVLCKRRIIHKNWIYHQNNIFPFLIGPLGSWQTKNRNSLSKYVSLLDLLFQNFFDQRLWNYFGIIRDFCCHLLLRPEKRRTRTFDNDRLSPGRLVYLWCTAVLTYDENFDLLEITAPVQFNYPLRATLRETRWPSLQSHFYGLSMLSGAV